MTIVYSAHVTYIDYAGRNSFTSMNIHYPELDFSVSLGRQFALPELEQVTDTLINSCIRQRIIRFVLS